MFTFLTPKPDADEQNNATRDDVTTARVRQLPTVLSAMFAGALLLTGCQQKPESAPVDNDSQPSEQELTEASKPVPQSDSAAAYIEQFQPLYVKQKQGLQRRLQAEYESLQAADRPDNNSSSLLNGATEATGPATDTKNTTTTAKSSAPAAAEQTDDAANAATNTTVNATDVDAEINTSTEIGERDLTVLKRISLEPRKPKILNEEQIINRYQQAMQALYQPVVTPLSAQDTDTLLNIATLVPQLFEHAEIASRVSTKSPALARLIVQHQIWEQIEAQQVLDMQQLKLDQQQEFENLMIKFNNTIKGYDEQIAKYEQTLKSFQ